MAYLRENPKAVEAMSKLANRTLDAVFDTGRELTEILGTGRMNDFDDLLLATLLTVWTSVISGSAGLTRTQANTRLIMLFPKVAKTLRKLEKAGEPIIVEKED